MSDWVSIPDLVMKEALELAASYAERSKRDDVSDFPADLAKGLIDFFKESGGCDHSVGICACGEEAAAQELLLALDGKRVCIICGGDGYTWDADKYEAARAEAAKEGYDASEGQGMVPCSKCDGAGVITLEGETVK